MQSQQRLYSLRPSPPATTVPASDQTRHNSWSAPFFVPMRDLPGVENRNLTPDRNQAPTATQFGLSHLHQRLNHNGFHLHQIKSVHSFCTFSDYNTDCLIGDDRYDSLLDPPEIRHSFLLSTDLSTNSKTHCLQTSTAAATTPVDAYDIPLSHRDIRYLTSSFNVDPSIMTTVVSMPGTPPDLSESRSSKSSSYGSQPSSPEDFCSGIINFEEIGLDDDKVDDADLNGSKKNSINEQSNKPVHKHTRQRPSLSAIQTQPKSYVRPAENGVQSAGVGPPKRGFTISGVVNIHGPSEQPSRTRSSSPPWKKPAVRSASLSSKPGISPSTGLHPRRGSWQPMRKTIREIEAEYHDSDDELPDDASLFNVPISPFPTGPRSARSSARGSPEREFSAHSPGPIPLAHARTAPDSPPRRTASSQALPRHRITPRSSTSNLAKSIPSSPQSHFRHNGRAKSWNIAMSSLSHEARVISEKLEYHLETGPVEDTILAHRGSAPRAIPLPPIQTGTLDFMPMSKEKQAILSRTRPSWLPPKNPEEEKRHLKEYQRMMKASLEAEKKREEKLKQQRSAKDETQASLNKIWTYYVDPSTDVTSIDKRVHDLCWRGIPSKVRGKVWQRRVGNSLGLTAASYEKAMQRAQEVKTKAAAERSDQEKSMIAWYADIERDAETAFPDLNVFQRNGPLWQDLINVCEAYTAYRSDVGYIYGLQLVAAILLLQLPEPAEVFILLANCLNKPMPLAFQTGDIAAVRRSYVKIMSTLEIKFPRLHDYLFTSLEGGGLGFRGDELFEPMFRTLFANGLDADRLSRVWDIWVFEGDRYLVRTAVALLGSLQSQIFDVQGDVHLKRRNVQEMLGWGPFNRSPHGYWDLQALGDDEAFVAEISNASRLETWDVEH